MKAPEKEGGVILFKNTPKDGGDLPENAPAYKGLANINGKAMDIALWVKEGKSGSKFFSGKISEPREATKSEKPKEPDCDSDLPF